MPILNFTSNEKILFKNKEHRLMNNEIQDISEISIRYSLFDILFI